MKKTLPLLVVLLLAGLALGGWKFLKSDGSTDRRALAPGDVVVPESSPAAPTQALAAPSTDAPERQAAAPAPEAAKTQRVQTPKVNADALWIEGRVSFPAETPIDEVVQVLAKGKRLGGKGSSREYRALVGADGRFRIALGKGTKKARISIEARYLHLEDKVTFDPRSEEELLLEPKLGGRLLVRFERADGKPWTEGDVEGLTLNARNNSSDSWELVKSRRVLLEDDSLALDLFEFGGVLPGDVYYMTTDSEVFVTENVEDASALAGETTEFEVALRVGARVRGKVTDYEGNPLPESQLKLTCRQGRSSQTEYLESDDAGLFDCGALDGGDYALHSDIDGYVESKMELGEIQLGQVIDGLVLECGRGKSISGRVLWPDGKAAAGATVRMEELGSERQWWDDNSNLKTDADETGAYEITGLSGDEVYRVYTRAKRTQDLDLEGLSKLKRKRALKAAPFWNAELERVEAGSSEVVLTLRSGAVFKGTVVDDEGTPIEKFRVTARPADDDGDFFGSGGGESITQSFDKTEGSFELEGLKPGSWNIGVFRSGYGPAKSITARVPGGPLSGEFVLARDAIVRGRVLDPDGKPVEGAKVNCELLNSDAGPFSFGSRGEATSKTDEEGRFELKRVSAGRSQITAEGEVIGAVDSKAEIREVPPASEVEGVVLTLRRGARVVARVHPSLMDRPNLEISVNELEGPIYRTEYPDESGVCTFEGLNPGRYRMRLEIPAPEEDSLLTEGLVSDDRKLEFEIAEGEEREVEIGTPASVTYSVTGTVLRGGEPLVGARVQMVTRVDNRTYVAVSGTGGGFSAQVETLGLLTITVRAPGDLSGVRFDRQLEEGAQTPFVLEVPYGVLRGVVYSSTGEVVSDLTVRLEATDVEESENGPRLLDPVDTDENGEFEFVGLLDGVYSLETVPERYGWWSNRDESKPVDAPASLDGIRVSTEESGVAIVEVRMEEGGTVRGIVTKPDGTSAYGLIVSLADEAGEMVWGSATQVGRNGSYQLKGLPEGKQHLSVRNRSGKRVTEKVVVVLGQETVLDFTFD